MFSVYITVVRKEQHPLDSEEWFVVGEADEYQDALAFAVRKAKEAVNGHGAG